MHTYERYQKGNADIGAIVIRFYHSGDQIRGFIRKVTEEDEDDTIFPSEELQVDEAFRMAENKHSEAPGSPVYVELAEGVRWNPSWGKLL